MVGRQQQCWISRTSSLFLTAVWAVSLLSGCGAEPEKTSGEAGDKPPVIEVTAHDYAFEAPDTIPSGWVTFRMTNNGAETHYLALHSLPAGRTYAEYRRQVFEPVDSLRRLLVAGAIDTTEAKKAAERILPAWEARVGQTKGGGVANLAPGRTTQTTVEMAPGTYVMRCVLRSPSGQTHASQGMIRSITVAEEGSEASPPEPDVLMRASGYDVSTEGALRAGTQTVAYHVEASAAEREDYYWSALLARIAPDTDMEELRHGITIQNPPPVEFLGGLEFVAPGKTAYTELDLKPGRYAWVLHGREDTVWTVTVQ